MKTSTNKSIVALATWLAFAPVLYPSSSEGCECIASAETKRGTIRYGGETHCYSFWAEAGQGAVVEAVDSSTSGDLYPRVRIYDPLGAPVGDSGPWPDRAEVDCQLKKTGIYTIVVSNGYGVATGEYGLSLVLAPGATTCLQDRDGGDMTIGGTQTGTIPRGGDLDARNLYGRAGQAVAIEVVDISALGLLYPRVRVYDPRGGLVADSGAWPDRAEVYYQLKENGIYTIVVSNGYGWAAGEYGLSISVMPPKDPHGLYPYGPQPADGNSISLCDPNRKFLSCRSVVGATGYDVYFASSPCMPPEKVAENTADPWVPMPALDPNGVYYWRVVAHTPSGDIEGPTWWFATGPCKPYVLALSATGKGAIVDPNVPVRECSPGEVVPITAKADPDFEFVRWEGTAVDANKTVVERQDKTGSKIWVTVDGVYTLRAVFEEVLFDFPLDIDPELTKDGQWEFGMPKGQGGEEHGNPDPTLGHTGQNVLGVNLNGDYDVRIGGPYSLVAGPFDLRGYRSVHLRFWSWLNTDGSDYVKNSLEMSLDGRTWLLVGHNPEREDTADNAWSRWEGGIGSWADDQPAVYLRWSYQVLAERAYPYSGWNLDDIQLIGRRQK